MSGEPLIVRSVEALREQVGAWRRSGLRVGLVPTMGALHEGHVTLVRAAFAGCDRVVVSIFVNPRQFAPSEDFALYPRREADDLAQLTMVGTQLVFMPPVEVVYPAGFATAVDGIGKPDAGPLRALPARPLPGRRHRGGQALPPGACRTPPISARRTGSSSRWCAA